MRGCFSGKCILLFYIYFFQELLSSKLNAVAHDVDPQLASSLTTHKLRHCTVACCLVDFSLGAKPIASVVVLTTADDVRR